MLGKNKRRVSNYRECLSKENIIYKKSLDAKDKSPSHSAVIANNRPKKNKEVPYRYHEQYSILNSTATVADKLGDIDFESLNPNIWSRK